MSKFVIPEWLKSFSVSPEVIRLAEAAKASSERPSLIAPPLLAKTNKLLEDSRQLSLEQRELLAEISSKASESLEIAARAEADAVSARKNAASARADAVFARRNALMANIIAVIAVAISAKDQIIELFIFLFQ